jgi:hypothetical protein
MATTFNVFCLGTGPLIDRFEEDYISEKASALVGTTFGGPGALVNNIHIAIFFQTIATSQLTFAALS